MQLKSVLERLQHVRKSGHSYSARCPAHKDGANSFSVTLKDGRIWLCCYNDCTFEEILTAMRINAGDLFTTEAAAAEDRESRIVGARQWWKRSRPIDGTIADLYLRECRGITADRPPASLRFLPSVLHREYGWPFPCLVAGIQDVNDNFAGISLTWLCADGRDKAPVEPSRKFRGICRGGAVRLGPTANVLAICEGIETGLSVRQACRDFSVWAAGSAHNLRHVQLPKDVHEVVICADADPPGESAARGLERRLIAEGREVRIAYPRLGGDFNDALRASA